MSDHTYTNTPIEDYGAYRFYTVVDYTGH